MPLPVAILAGGLATRLGPITRTTPKSLVPVGGKPFIHHQLDTLRSNGIQRVVVCAGHLGDQIERELGAVHDLDIEIIRDWPRLLGTAGALRAAGHLLGEAFFVLYGDSYLVCDYQRIQRSFERAAKPALMTVCIENNSPNACYANGRVLLYDKRRADLRMHHIDYGLGIWLRETILNSTEDDLADTYHRLAAIHCLAGYEWPVRYVSIGNTEGLKAAEKLLATPPASGLHQQASDDGSSRSDEPPQ